MIDLLEEIVSAQTRGESAALASVVSSKGSLPMSRRSKMLLTPDGRQHGTVGGGCLEAEVHAMGQKALRSSEAILTRFTLTEKQAGAEGLNCGGTVEILIEPLSPTTPATAGLYRQALDALKANEELVLATLVSQKEEGNERSIVGRGLVSWKGLRAGVGAIGEETGLTEHVVEESLAILGQDLARWSEVPKELASPKTRLLLETLSAPPTLYLFGGGHVSLAVARVARTAGFRVVVVDDRPAFANPERFPEAERTLVLPMEEAMAQLPIDATSYIVAVTRGHQHDEPVIEQAIRTRAAYIGMIGSKRKVALLWKRLAARGATQEMLERVHAPIGLEIGADSPGEIAVAIVAQLIEVRRRAR